MSVGAFNRSEIAKFNNPDSPGTLHPQLLNRYAYVANNPLKYNDPTGHFLDWVWDAISIGYDIYALCKQPSWGNAGALGIDIVLGIIPFVPSGAGLVKAAGKAVSAAVKEAKIGKTIVKAAEGFDTFAKLKKAYGAIGENKVLHHIVEQCQTGGRTGFDAKMIHNKNNVIAIDALTIQRIADYYSSSQQAFTGGKTVRDWLTGQSFEDQYKFGLWVLEQFGVIT